MTKLPYEEWEKEYIKTNCNMEEIENLKGKYYFGMNTYEEFKSLLKHEYQSYCEQIEKL